ncbi:MAG: hypothetical protein OXG15_07150 [Gammaproteobacteria bacterium]|nr:hypothetical protein [Gammaproteobacteria bacterium]
MESRKATAYQKQKIRRGNTYGCYDCDGRLAEVARGSRDENEVGRIYRTVKDLPNGEVDESRLDEFWLVVEGRVLVKGSRKFLPVVRLTGLERTTPWGER